MLRNLAIGILCSGLVIACDPCGPPAEPLINTTITLGVTPGPNDYLHVEMLNGAGLRVTSTALPIGSSPLGAKLQRLLGACDGTQQISGLYTVRAWSNLETYGETALQPTDPQAAAMVEVTCTADDGCVAAHSISLTLAAP